MTHMGNFHFTKDKRNQMTKLLLDIFPDIGLSSQKMNDLGELDL